MTFTVETKKNNGMTPLCDLCTVSTYKTGVVYGIELFVFYMDHKFMQFG